MSQADSASNAPFGMATHAGHRRRLNEDALCAVPESGLWVIADGMGGHEGGEVASRLVVDFLREQTALGEALDDSTRRAHHIVQSAAREGLGAPGMGSTVVALQLQGHAYSVVWVGDSRAYLYAEAGLRRLTRDHSFVQQLMDEGLLSAGDAERHPYRNVITQAVGADDVDHIEVEQTHGILFAGQSILLCSDGLNRELSDSEILAILEDRGEAQDKADRLLAAALDRGGSDNISIIVVTAPADAPPADEGEPTIPFDLSV